MNRKGTEAKILSILDQLGVGADNKPIYKALFKSMSDPQFTAWMGRLASEEEHLAIVVSEGTGTVMKIERAIKVAKEMGIELFTKVITTDADGVEEESQHDALVISIPIKRVAQSLEKGIGVAEDDEHVDMLTAQPTKKSTGSSITAPEIADLDGIDLKATAIEFSKDRGGDRGAYNAMLASIAANGRASQKEIHQFESGVDSAKTLRSFYIGMHISPE